MLSISLEPEEYVTIGDIVVKVAKMTRGRCFLCIDADRSIPIVRSAVLERNGMPPPACLLNLPSRKRPKYRREAIFRWNDDRERAVNKLYKLADQLEKNGADEEARLLCAQLAQIVPASWEEELPEKQVSSG